MSPFAVKLKSLRETRGIKQKDLAHRLGYEPSYLSALERSEKGPPRQDFIDRLIGDLNLNAEEQTELLKAVQMSRRHVSLPAQATAQEYELHHMLVSNLGQLQPFQIQLIKFALCVPRTFWTSEEALAMGLGCPQSIRMEAPKM